MRRRGAATRDWGARAGVELPPVVVCPVCGAATPVPQAFGRWHRCEACAVDLEEWVEAALDREDVALRCVAVALLAAVYHAPMYLLLHKALIDSDEAVREAAWRVVAQPVVARTADGEQLSMLRLYDRLTAAQRLHIQSVLPRAAELGPAVERATPVPSPGPAQRPPARTPQAGPAARPVVRSKASPAGRRLASELPPCHDGPATDGLTLAALTAEARVLIDQLDGRSRRA